MSLSSAESRPPVLLLGGEIAAFFLILGLCLPLVATVRPPPSDFLWARVISLATGAAILFVFAVTAGRLSRATRKEAEHSRDVAMLGVELAHDFEWARLQALGEEESGLSLREPDRSASMTLASLLDRVADQQRRIAQAQLVIPLWERMSRLRNIDRSNPIARDVSEALSTMELIAIFAETDTIHVDLVERALGEPFIHLYELVASLPAGRDLLEDRPTRNFYRRLKVELQRKASAPFATERPVRTSNT